MTAIEGNGAEQSGGGQGDSGIDREILKKALKAFKKRLKLTRLDDESRLGVRPTSSDRESGITAIKPPDQYGQEVWDELARQGKIRDAGYGLYDLVRQ